MAHRMRKVVQRPVAAAIVNSMRAMGYSFDAAIADIIDNSIAAEATKIEITLRTRPSVILAIADNGKGMSAETLLAAMRHGSSDPRLARNAEDLGRYGLGLKTASLSQCRCLTVATLHEGVYSGARWDLDEVEAANDWVLTLLDEPDVRELPFIQLLGVAQRGTVVLWEEFDRAAAGRSDEARALEQLVDGSRAHLALTFHRFLRRENQASAIDMSINGLALPVVDPFLTSNVRTEQLPSETIWQRGYPVGIRPYILPHLSYIAGGEIEGLGGRQALRQSQGFYLYRNRRLICYGTWFRLITLDELSKLARVAIDIPNALDDLWNIDVRKSTAHPPEAVRRELRRVIDRIAERSANVFRERRRKLSNDKIVRLWMRHSIRGGIKYELNREYPLLLQLSEQLPAQVKRHLEELLHAIEIGLPADAIYADIAADNAVGETSEEIYNQLRELATTLITCTNGTAGRSSMINHLLLLEPFSLYQSLTRRLIEELENGK